MQSKSIRYCLIILIITSLNSFAYAKDGHFVKIENTSVNLENNALYINGENFGENPEVWLDNDILSVQFNNDNYIEAALPDSIDAGTYRLIVDRQKNKEKKGQHHLFPIWKFITAPGYRDKIDITIGVTGPQGPEGETGLQGLAGLKGETGNIGPQGLTGLQGPTGLKGDTGDIGPQGLTGLQGPTGLKGDTGDIGPQGLTGLQGSTGVKGDTGPQGLTGPVGPQGPEGNTGLQGSTGSKGDKGDNGAPGMSGYGIVSKNASITLLSFGGNSYALSVACPSGKKVLGGGGKSNYNGNLLSESYPNISGDGWTIKYTNQSAYTKTISLSVYAICAECQ